MSVTKHVALVTGASRGIGKAIALRLGQDPALTIIGSSTTEQGAENITQYLEEAKIKAKVSVWILVCLLASNPPWKP